MFLGVGGGILEKYKNFLVGFFSYLELWIGRSEKENIRMFTKYSTAISLGPVVQSIVNLTSSLVVKTLTILVSTISNSKVFLLKKCE